MSDPIRTKRRGVERKGERKKVEWNKGGKEDRGGGKFEKGERGDVVIPPPPIIERGVKRHSVDITNVRDPQRSVYPPLQRRISIVGGGGR